ncbi:hypothetical protein TFKS16_1106 [Tannerella forsythia KS16]|nr:hypothetical protein TF3313_0983 [Tannerella forsythia 3313]BAR51378.1 hypothetical protein TFKS16_1106 [Tannerella forsythia KS16]
MMCLILLFVLLSHSCGVTASPLSENRYTLNRCK